MELRGSGEKEVVEKRSRGEESLAEVERQVPAPVSPSYSGDTA